MSPFSRPVLLPSLVLCSPVLLDAYGGATSWTDALYRFLLVLGICWVAVSVVHAFAFSPSRPDHRPGEGDAAGEQGPGALGATAGPLPADGYDGQRPPGS